MAKVQVKINHEAIYEVTENERIAIESLESDSDKHLLLQGKAPLSVDTSAVISIM